MSPQKKSFKKTTDHELLRNIFTGVTKSPISRENWKSFVESTYTVENTLAFTDISKYAEVYDRVCSLIGIPSNIEKSELLIVTQFEKNISFENEVKNEEEILNWSKSTCLKLIELYIKNGADKEVNISAELRERCLSKYSENFFHPSIFNDIKEATLLIIIENDIPLFKKNALDINIHRKIKRKRALVGSIVLCSVVIIYSCLLSFQVSQYYRLIGFPLLLWISVFLLSSYYNFCPFAAKSNKIYSKVEVLIVADEYACKYQNKKGNRMILTSLGISIGVTILLFFVPPFNW